MLLDKWGSFANISGMKSALSLCFYTILTVLARACNFGTIFLGGQIFFVDSDCYSRMTRVRMVLAHPFTVIRRHTFENYPQGTISHVTAPFDYLVAALAVLFKPFAGNHVDLAGAMASPLIGAATVIFLWWWTRRAQVPYRGMALLLFAISPILVHGTILGRPDHQSLQMLCVAVALGAEWCLAQEPSRGWGIASGIAWGLGLWTSLYEPLILLLIVLFLYLIFDRRKLVAKERRDGYLLLAGILLVAVLVQGWPYSIPGKTFTQYFPKWEHTVGELSSAGIFSMLIYRWTGFGLIAAPVVLAWRSRQDKRLIALLVMVLALWGLTLWQIRWGYFFVLVFAMAAPFVFGIFRKPWMAWTVLILSLWPVFRDWDDNLFPNDEKRAQIREQKLDELILRDAVERLKSNHVEPVMAPWWFSPAIAYWSGQPTVAGSSHESLPGIVDSARFFLTDNPGEALKILQSHGAKWVVAYDPDRVLKTSSTLLDRPVPELPMARILYERPHSAPPFLKFAYAYQLDPAFKVFRVEDVVP